jgi:hypothetical protein
MLSSRLVVVVVAGFLSCWFAIAAGVSVDDCYFEVGFWCCDDAEAIRSEKTSEKLVNLARNEVALRKSRHAQSERWRNVGTSAGGGGGGC